MKKIFSLMMVACAALTFTACSDNDDEQEFDAAANLDYTEENAEQWANYMTVVSGLLKDDATSLYNYWTNETNDEYSTSYANIFKAHDGNQYKNGLECIEEILDGCAEIANEVGGSKIGDPYNFWKSGKKTQALYAVESWYSWHSIDDYTNNIVSIRNSYLGTRAGTSNKLALFTTPAAEHSLAAFLQKANKDLADKAEHLIQGAATAIQTITPPFRNHIGSDEAKQAMLACADLQSFISDELKPAFDALYAGNEAEFDLIINTYVDDVVVPTYKELMEKNTALDKAVNDFKAAPSNQAFQNCANAWLEAREPWESSEAFLFGPVDAKQLDPNMDSWPLDQVGIVNILKSQNWNNLNWNEGQSEKAIEKAQALRGFHTLEYFIFKDGKARTVPQVAAE